MITIIFNIFKSKGPVVVYSNYVDMEGLQIFRVYLSFFGFKNFSDSNNLELNKDNSKNKDKDNDNDNDNDNEIIENSPSKLTYMEFHGKIDKDTRTRNKAIYNDIKNKYGNIIKIILISPAGAEGINLANVRQIHIMEPFWNEVRIEQIIGRGVRQCQHKSNNK